MSQDEIITMIDDQIAELGRAPVRALAEDRIDELRVLRKRILREVGES